MAVFALCATKDANNVEDETRSNSTLHSSTKISTNSINSSILSDLSYVDREVEQLMLSSETNDENISTNYNTMKLLLDTLRVQVAEMKEDIKFLRTECRAKSGTIDSLVGELTDIRKKLYKKKLRMSQWYQKTCKNQSLSVPHHSKY